MKVGDRVRFAHENSRGLQLGTVTHITEEGQVIVVWEDGTRQRFTPWAAKRRLAVVTGDDALPRHRWTTCTDCGAAQTNENEFGPCRGAK